MISCESEKYPKSWVIAELGELGTFAKGKGISRC